MMSIPRVTHRARVKVRQRAGRRAGNVSPGAIATRRGARRSRSPLEPLQPEWNSFISRCLRSWESARASASMFLAVWTPLVLPEVKPPESSRRHRARRRPSATAHRARRTARHPVDLTAHATWSLPVAAAGSAEALRRRYPLVSALLVELAADRAPRRPIPRALRL